MVREVLVVLVVPEVLELQHSQGVLGHQQHLVVPYVLDVPLSHRLEMGLEVAGEKLPGMVDLEGQVEGCHSMLPCIQGRNLPCS